MPETPSGYAVIYHRLNNPKASNYNFDEAVKTYFMLLETCLYHQGPRPGLVCLFDMENVGLSHLLRVKIGTIRKFFHYLQEGLPAKLKAIHVLNAVSFFDKVLYLIKPFMRAEILNMVSIYLRDVYVYLRKLIHVYIFSCFYTPRTVACRNCMTSGFPAAAYLRITGAS